MPATPPLGSIAASRLKLERPEKFDGTPAKLSNWLFNVHQFCTVSGVTTSEEIVKVAVTLLEGKALTWWRAVSIECWAALGLCSWREFSQHLEAEFRDVHHCLRNQTKLFDLKQKGSVARYNEEFRSLVLEVRHVMSA